MTTWWGTASQMLTGEQMDWHTACELLNAGQYERVSELLHTAQVAFERTEETAVAHLLLAARGISEACSQTRSELEWHRQGLETADQRERELQQQLHTILDLIRGQVTQGDDQRQENSLISSPKLAANPERVQHLGLRERVQNLFGWGAVSHAAVGPPDNYPEAPPAAPDEQPEAPVAPLVEKPEPDEHRSPKLVANCLGPFRVYINDKLVEKWPGLKCKAILKYLIVHRERPVHREILMDLFWRDTEPEAARRNLYQAIYSLRQALQNGGPDFPYILCEDSGYHLNPEMELWVDDEAFSTHYQTGQRLEREDRLHEATRAYEMAENLYVGDFLAEDRYEDWPTVRREKLKHSYLDILDRLSQYYFDQAELTMCISFCQKILEQDNCREDAHRRLMRCYVRKGQRNLALRQYHVCVEALEQELDVPPMPATIELYRQIQLFETQFSPA